MAKFKGFIPQELLNSISEKKCILFVGAGLSSKVIRSNGKALPSWKVLLSELLEYCIDKRIPFSINVKDLEQMIANDNLIMVAQEIQETISRYDFGEFLQKLFRDKSVVPSSTHLLLPSIPFRSIMTSNYDHLIEGAYTLKNLGSIPNKFTQEDLLTISSPLRKEDFYIFKVHGDFDRPNSIILGSRDYQKLFFRSPEYRQFLETLFSVYTVLFVGYGASDPDLDNILERLSTIFDRTLDKHYILLPENRFNFVERKRLLLDKRLEVIEYENDSTHSQVDAFIQELVDYFDDKPLEERDIKKYDVFISYSHADISEVNKLSQYLSSNGISVWYDKELEPLQDIKIALTSAISDSRFMIIVVSEKYQHSKWLWRELEIGLLKQLESKIKIIPVAIGNIDFDDIPAELKNTLFLKLERNFTAADLTPLLKMLNSAKRK